MLLLSAAASLSFSLIAGPSVHTPLAATSCRSAAALATADPLAAARLSTGTDGKFPPWPEWERPPAEYEELVATFVEGATTVPLGASAGQGVGWEEWADGGFSVHLLLTRRLSRQTYIAALDGLLGLVVRCQQTYPDLYAVLKFVPKKNGLNPLLARRADGKEVAPLDGGKPREVRRALDDVQRALEQSWLLVAAYLTLPTAEEREDLLWSARTVTEKVKTDQRSRSLEVLCLAFFWRGADEYRLLDRSLWPSLKSSFETNFGGNWHPKPTNARLIWQRCRMVYPFLEIANRAWLCAAAAARPEGEAEEWWGEDLASELGIATDVVRKNLSIWLNRGFISEVRDAGGGAVFEAATSLGAGDESRHDAGEDEDGDAVASLAEEQRIAEMKVYEQYVIGMLTNLESLPVQRIHNMLKMFVPASGGDRGYDCSEQELQRFLMHMVEEAKLEHSAGQYRIAGRH